MEEKKRAINWYPGHMTKARRMMEEDIKLAIFAPAFSKIGVGTNQP